MPLNVDILHGSVRTDRWGTRAARFTERQFTGWGHHSGLVDTLEFQLPLLGRMHNAHGGDARVVTEEENVNTVLLSGQPAKNFAQTEERQALVLVLCLDSAASINGTALAVVGSRTTQ